MSKASDLRKASTPRRFVEPPKGAVRLLQNAACRDVSIARLTLGLYDAIIGDESTRLFRGYAWRLSEIEWFPKSAIDAAKKLFDWGQKPGVVLNEVYLSRETIVKAVTRLRRHSPYGRRCLRNANALTKKYSLRREATNAGLTAPPRLRDVSILDELTGQPLNGRAIRLIEAFKPAVIQIATSRDSLAWGATPATVIVRLGSDGYSVESIAFTVEVADAPPIGRRITGVLHDFFETGTEGLVWSLVDEESFDHESLHVLEEGDHLTISNQLGNRIWAGTIRCDRKSGWRRYPMNPEYGQPCALGYWIHWTQKGFNPDDWARFFVKREYDRCRGVLVKKKVAGLRHNHIGLNNATAVGEKIRDRSS